MAEPDDVRRLGPDIWFDVAAVTNTWSAQGQTLYETRLGNLVHFDGTDHGLIDAVSAVFVINGLGLPVPPEVLAQFAVGER